jgi:predicted nucleic acid-binding protein
VTGIVFDTTALSHFARADRLRELHALAGADDAVLLREVSEELGRGVPLYPELARVAAAGWLRLADLTGPAELAAFARYRAQLGGAPERNNGEAAVLAWVSVHGGIAIIDEEADRNLGVRDGLRVHRSLRLLLTRGLKEGALDRVTVEAIVDDLIRSGMRLPVASGAALFDWARDQGLLSLSPHIAAGCAAAGSG